jgi:diguanylate cyclase (GGDEF)-like protein
MMNTQPNEIQLESAIPLLPLPQNIKASVNQSVDLQFIYALNSSLDFKTILEQFAAGLHQKVIYDSLEYQNTEFDTSIKLGEHQVHQLNYSLKTQEADFGKLTITRDEIFSDSEISSVEEMLCFLMNPLANATEHYRALHSALSDPLTGVHNRSSLSDMINREIELAKRHDTEFAVLLLDLDNFKHINDQYGHAAGDAVLQHLTHIAHELVRQSDFIFRQGGDEFLILLSNTSRAGATILAERLRLAVEKSACLYKDNDIHYSVSIGVGAFTADDDMTSLLEHADQALYRSKERGRNCVSS